MIRFGQELDGTGWGIDSDGVGWKVGKVRVRQDEGEDERLVITRPSYYVRIDKAVESGRQKMLQWAVQHTDELTPNDVLDWVNRILAATSDLANMADAGSAWQGSEWDSVPVGG